MISLKGWIDLFSGKKKRVLCGTPIKLYWSISLFFSDAISTASVWCNSFAHLRAFPGVSAQSCQPSLWLHLYILTFPFPKHPHWGMCPFSPSRFDRRARFLPQRVNFRRHLVGPYSLSQTMRFLYRETFCALKCATSFAIERTDAHTAVFIYRHLPVRGCSRRELR